MSHVKRRSQPIDQHVGRRMKERRVALGISQTALADRLGITFQQVQKYESGTNRMSAARIYTVSIALGCEISYLFEGITGKQPKPMFDQAPDKGTLETVRMLMRMPAEARHSLNRFLKDVLL